MIQENDVAIHENESQLQSEIQLQDEEIDSIFSQYYKRNNSTTHGDTAYVIALLYTCCT